MQRSAFARTFARRARCGSPSYPHARIGARSLRILREEGAREVGGVMHCFTEAWDVARAAIDLGFHISFSAS